MDHWTTSYWVAGDTTIDGLTYTRVRSRIVYWESTIMSMDCNAWEEYDGETHFVRETDRQVLMHIDGAEDRLLYDFTVSVGDSIPFPSNFPTNTAWQDDDQWAMVVATDSVLIEGTYRERLVIDTSASPDYSWGRPYVIEGIGGGQGPFQPLCAQVGISHGIALICVSEQGSSIFGETPCWIYTGVQSPIMGTALTAYPNPTTGFVHFDGIVEYSVVNMTGNRIFFGRGHTLDLVGQESGLYLIRSRPTDGHLVSNTRILLLAR